MFEKFSDMVATKLGKIMKTFNKTRTNFKKKLDKIPIKFWQNSDKISEISN